MKKKKMRLISLVVSIFVVLTFTANVYAVDLGYRLLKFGHIGSDVKQLQSKLQLSDYYYQHLDGIYGHGTESAVINFQRDNKLSIDGIAGDNTITKLKQLTKKDGVYYVRPGDTLSKIAQQFNVNINQLRKWNNTNYNYIYPGQEIKLKETQIKINNYNLTENDLDLLARAVYSEARGETIEGQVAVAAVILNRLRHDEFPDTIKGVVFQPWAFTAVHDGQFWLTPNDEARDAVELALKGWDPTYGAAFYYNPAKVTSYWIYSRKVITKIGKHYFAS
ncbi:MAG: spore cortex-lytic enzyme [Bacillota bacterium]